MAFWKTNTNPRTLLTHWQVGDMLATCVKYYADTAPLQGEENISEIFWDSSHPPMTRHHSTPAKIQCSTRLVWLAFFLREIAWVGELGLAEKFGQLFFFGSFPFLLTCGISRAFRCPVKKPRQGFQWRTKIREEFFWRFSHLSRGPSRFPGICIHNISYTHPHPGN